MKNLKKNAGILILFSAIIFTVNSCTKDDSPAKNSNNSNNSYGGNIQSQIGNLPKEPLNDTELYSLSYMREEEKLARDVYIAMYNKWGVTIFSNILNSEQMHMEAILILLNRYSLKDPAESTTVGVFNNVTLQNLYNHLLVKGNTSLPEAYKVGATIEDLDIFDLMNSSINIDNQDIRLVYDMLAKGSRNHMRSFYKNILMAGDTYVPKYITQAEFNAIINSAMEKGF